MTDLALETGLTASNADYLNMVKVSADFTVKPSSMKSSTFPRSKRRKLRLDTVDFSLRESLGDTFKGLRCGRNKKGLSWCAISRRRCRWLEGRPGRLQQVVVNLVGNAIKFTSEGEVVMDVTVESQAADGVVLHFAVRDTGIGIPPDKKRENLRAFRQADTSTTRQYGGTGLGLTISTRLVEMMGGQIGVDSEPAEGAPSTSQPGSARQSGHWPARW